MINKYLEKISGFGYGNLFGTAVRAVGKSVMGLGKTVGRQFVNAGGGAYREYAAKNFAGYNDPNRLAKMTQGEFARNLKNSIPKTTPGKAGFMERNNQYRKVMGDLRDQTNSARLNAGLITGGTLLAGHAFLNRSNQNNYQGYDNNVYY